MAPKETSPSGYGTIPSSSTAPSAPPPPSPTNVQVIAPATLQAGYTFDAMYDGVTFTVTVPEGGVVKGQRFIVPFVPPAGQDAVPRATAVGEPISSANSGGGGGGSTIPTGVWRDSLCDCLRFGPCHPHFLNAWFCRLVLMGQILTRMKMTWLGFRTRGNPDDRRWKSTFSIMVKLTIAYYVLDILTSPADPETGDDDVNVTLNSVIGSAMFFYTTYVLIQLRATLRHVYSIPEESCLCLYEMGLCGNNPREGICGSGSGGGGDDDGSSSTRLCTSGVAVGWEDVCCAFWCPLCVAGQMARHTVDYEERGRRAVCCNEVGVENWEEDDAYEGVVRVGEGSVLVV
mmetsp:Transcript_5288/g.10334  ORF Transcript_5288/g.10334 Transcript_5288/m.10334 type:complete len:344 (+) Transcript_5288:164-1195(+)|eukprot:CAMPEP_0171349188 /NCGR_PEP_ID=MMETSP0878-20121228/32963_1 /TAXON_ID=67004 /ORGANISM="Thalassiosira weissflogii, Strain CCMP1336" /LENGTH=343 /DNA_ID=CAMNT_0011853761 /DNA_START=89 /DNA_END=1120 /DNA_ORIENTATION=+